MTYYFLIIVMVLAGVTLLPIRRLKFCGMQKSLDLKTSTAVRGFAAVMVFVSHTVSGDITILNNFADQGRFAVAIFFFLSGTGLFISYQKRQNYLKDIVLKKIPELYLTCAAVNVLYAVVYHALGVTNFTFWEYVLRIFDFGFATGFEGIIGEYNWFMRTIIVFYVLFVISFAVSKKAKNKFLIAALILTLLITAYFIVGITLNTFGTVHEGSFFLFPLGIIYAKFNGRINAFILKNYVLLILTSAVFTALWLLPLPQLIHFALIFPLSLAIVVIILTAALKLNIKSYLTYFLGLISVEIYLLQGLIIQTTRTLVSNQFLNLCLTFLILLLTASAFHYFVGLIKKPRAKNLLFG